MGGEIVGGEQALGCEAAAGAETLAANRAPEPTKSLSELPNQMNECIYAHKTLRVGPFKCPNYRNKSVANERVVIGSSRNFCERWGGAGCSAYLE